MSIALAQDGSRVRPAAGEVFRAFFSRVAAGQNYDPLGGCAERPETPDASECRLWHYSTSGSRIPAPSACPIKG